MLLAVKAAVPMVLVNVPIAVGVVRHDSRLPALASANLEHDRVLDRAGAGTQVDDLGIVGPRNGVDAFAVLLHGRKL